mmetsp:Transcript_13442/g.41597  ORF Transcript_13442/g.41597 Transcript_13442/m.41597 type:complete len:277 (+) Transcript_13442:2654-3484(+)
MNFRELVVPEPHLEALPPVETPAPAGAHAAGPARALRRGRARHPRGRQHGAVRGGVVPERFVRSQVDDVVAVRERDGRLRRVCRQDHFELVRLGLVERAQLLLVGDVRVHRHEVEEPVAREAARVGRLELLRQVDDVGHARHEDQHAGAVRVARERPYQMQTRLVLRLAELRVRLVVHGVDGRGGAALLARLRRELPGALLASLHFPRRQVAVVAGSPGRRELFTRRGRALRARRQAHREPAVARAVREIVGEEALDGESFGADEDWGRAAEVVTI